MGRLTSGGGGSFALIPIDDLVSLAVGDASTMWLDVEILTPDRLVRYLSRQAPPEFLHALADAFVAAAERTHPELEVPTVECAEAGVSVQFVASGEFTVDIEVLVVIDLAEDLIEHDGINLDVTRASLVGAAHELRDAVEQFYGCVEGLR